MSLFRIEVETVIKHISEIVVEADDLSSALEYAKTNNEWNREVDNIANEIQSYKTVIPVAGRSISSLADLPKNYHDHTVPWNTTTSKDIGTILLRQEYPNIFDKKIVDVFKLSVRTLGILKNNDIVYIGQLVQFDTKDILRMKNFGRISLNELVYNLNTINLSFNMSIDWEIPTD